MIDRIVLEPAEDRLAPTPKVLVLTSVSDIIYVSIEKQDEDNTTCTTRVLQDKEATEGEGLERPMQAQIVVDAADLQEAVQLLRHREERFEERLKTEKADEDRRKVEQPWRDLEGAVAKANYRAEKLHTQYLEAKANAEALSQEVVELQEALGARRAMVEQEMPKHVDLSEEESEEIEVEAS